MPNAIITVSDKSKLDILCPFLVNNDFTIYSTGGTYKHICSLVSQDKVKTIESITQFPEILNGRVKTLHPNIYGGILADREQITHSQDIERHNLILFDLVVVNLYPFEKENTIENIDIGGVSLIRASAKNYKFITLLSTPLLYKYYIERFNNITLEMRKDLADIGFKHTSEYDNLISQFLSTDKNKIELKYGANPHQNPAYLEVTNQNAIYKPFDIINGKLGYINILDIVHGWLIVREIDDVSEQTAFISMKHTSPAGLGVGEDISKETLDIFGIDNILRNNLTSCSKAFIKSRCCDPLSSFGDFICCSSTVDLTTAQLIKKEICDGIVAVDYEPEALELLRQKKKGNFIIIKMSMEYYESYKQSGWIETKEIYGLKLSQPYNDYVYSNIDLDLDKDVAYSVLKYSQSNNVSMVYNGQLIGIGCGQQNRVACVKLAGDKSLIWRMRHTNTVIEYYNSLDKNLKRQEKVNLVYDYISNHKENLLKEITEIPITLGSDGFFPFTDNIDEANKYSVKKIIQPGGSIADNDVLQKCKEYNIELENVGKRMFYH